jgi:hypothetical protein
MGFHKSITATVQRQINLKPNPNPNVVAATDYMRVRACITPIHVHNAPKHDAPTNNPKDSGSTLVGSGRPLISMIPDD